MIILREHYLDVVFQFFAVLLRVLSVFICTFIVKKMNDTSQRECL